MEKIGTTEEEIRKVFQEAKRTRMAPDGGFNLTLASGEEISQELREELYETIKIIASRPSWCCRFY